MTRYVKLAGKRISLSTVVYLIYIVYYISGYNGAGHNYIKAGMFMLWNVAAFWEDSGAYQRALFCIPNIFIGGFILFHFFSSTIVGSIMYTLEYTMTYLMIYGCFTQFLYYKNRNNNKEMSMIVGTALVAFVFFAIRAIGFYIQNPSAARTLASNYYVFDTIAVGGGYRIAFGSAILLVGIFEMVLNGRLGTTTLSKIVWLLAVALLVFLLVKTESTITLIAAVTGLAIAAVNKFAYGKEGESRGLNTRKMIGTMLIMLLLLIIFLNINNIGEAIINFFGDDMDNVLNRRFYRIGEKLYYFGREGDVHNYVDSRLDTVKSSWNTFLQYPLLGVGYKCGNILQPLSEYGVGTHSTVFDALAQHGIIGASMFFAFLYTVIKKAHSTVRSIGCLGTLLIMMVLNPFSYFHGYFVAFALLPMLGHLCNNYGLNNKMEENA